MIAPLRATLGALLAVGLAAGLVAACRPPLADETDPSGPDSSPGAAETVYPTNTPPPAFALKPATETNVQARLFRAQDAAEASLQYAQALDSYREVNLIVDLVPPIAGYDLFAVDPAAGIVTAWIGTVADVAPAPADLDLVAVAEVSGRDPTVVVRPAAGSGPIGVPARPDAGGHDRRRGVAAGGPGGWRRDRDSRGRPAG